MLAMIVASASAVMQPAQAQTADTWKSVAIIGGSTAAGAYIGHKIAGPTGTWIGAGIGASAGYAIDRRRRANEYYNQSGYGSTDPNAGYYGNGGYYASRDNTAAYPGASPYPGNNDSQGPYRQDFSPRRSR
jgi:hypothetical protein